MHRDIESHSLSHKMTILCDILNGHGSLAVCGRPPNANSDTKPPLAKRDNLDDHFTKIKFCSNS